MKRREFEPIVLRAAVAIPEVDVGPGDDLVIDPAAPRLFTVLKRLPDEGAIAAIERYCFIREPGRPDLPGREPPK